MTARVVALSYPVGIPGINTADEFIVYAARVSNPANQINNETAPKLINYLVNHEHWSPLEMVSATIEFETTRDIARQMLRHRSFSFQEFSQRYADPTQLGFTISEARLQDTKNRQNSIVTEDEELQQWWDEAQRAVVAFTDGIYEQALAKGIAKEQSRKVKPEGLTNSKLYMAGTLRSWYHYIKLRSANGTQKEHSIEAIEAGEALQPYFPSIKFTD